MTKEYPKGQQRKSNGMIRKQQPWRDGETALKTRQLREEKIRWRNLYKLIKYRKLPVPACAPLCDRDAKCTGYTGAPRPAQSTSNPSMGTELA